MPDNDLVAAYKSIPIVTRTLLTATILISLGVAVHAISYYSMMLDFKAVLYRFHVAASYIGLPYLFQSLLLAVIYLWSMSNSDRIVSFMFGIQFKARYLPGVLMAYNYVVGGAMIPWAMIIGAASAHLYYFLDSQYPAMGGPRLIPTPSLLYRILPAQEVVGAAANFRSGGTPAADAGGHRWGTGNRLG
ncbi:hypothetical protein BGZ81_001183 [Podila clonocystis]|nr:hypothetical protein BGZ81_001183 [Podila clonocystis]